MKLAPANTNGLILITGGPGSGKTFLANRFAEVQHLKVFRRPHQNVLPFLPPWDLNRGSIIDEVTDYPDFARVWPSWEAEAVRMGRLIILVLKARDELARLGVQLKQEPLIFATTAPGKPIDVIQNGVRFTGADLTASPMH